MIEQAETAPSTPPTDPRLILAAAIVLPGSGHVMLGLPMRGLQFLFFMVILAWITTKFAPADASFIGRHAGGVLIYALSILDAYKIGRIRHAKWLFANRNEPGQGQSAQISKKY
jgi:hypothetical protein